MNLKYEYLITTPSPLQNMVVTYKNFEYFSGKNIGETSSRSQASNEGVNEGQTEEANNHGELIWNDQFLLAKLMLWCSFGKLKFKGQQNSALYILGLFGDF